MIAAPEGWWRGATLYQIYPLSFADSNGDGWGDLPGIESRLDYVASLGVDGLWLSPFFESPFADFGYDTTNQQAVDPRLGTLADFDRLVDRAHALGLKVVIDQVYTYTSNRHPWFVESRQDRSGPRGDWYVWADAKPDGSAPNNWISIFGGPAWEWSRSRRQYYMTHFLPEMPHLRVEHPAVQEALLGIGRFWLDRGVDGFRLDVINLAVVDRELRDNPPSGQVGFAMPGLAQSAIYDRSRPEALDFVTRIRRMTDERSGRFLLGELAGPDAMNAAKTYTSGSDRLHSAYHVLAADAGPSLAVTLRQELAAWTETTEGWPTWSFSNHDVVRGPTRCAGPNAEPQLAQLLLGVLAAARGTMLLYQGDELGLPDGDVPFALLRDPATRRFHPDYLQRDGSRTPMPWLGSAPHAGFTTGDPWLPLGPMHSSLAVDVQERTEDSTLAVARALVALRRREEALRIGDMRVIETPDPLLCLERSHGSRVIRCTFNVSHEPAMIPRSDAGHGASLFARGATVDSEGRTRLEAYGFDFRVQQPG
jgi:alpha-glucosidase